MLKDQKKTTRNSSRTTLSLPTDNFIPGGYFRQVHTSPYTRPPFLRAVAYYAADTEANACFAKADQAENEYENEYEYDNENVDVNVDAYVDVRADVNVNVINKQTEALLPTHARRTGDLFLLRLRLLTLMI